MSETAVPKRLTTIRLSAETDRKIEELVKKWGSPPRSEVIAIAIDRLYQQEKEKTMDQSLYDQARQRVDNTPELQPFEDTIFYDWPEGDDHWKWVATAPVPEIVDWAETVGNNDADAVAISNE
jgi:Arc/MetJ-type ribon-helix-helix transcriptional regulator